MSRATTRLTCRRRAPCSARSRWRATINVDRCARGANASETTVGGLGERPGERLDRRIARTPGKHRLEGARGRLLAAGEDPLEHGQVELLLRPEEVAGRRTREAGQGADVGASLR